jgi:hypothetical protein
MPIPNDLLEAKQMLSARFLSIGAERGVVGRFRTLNVMAAAESAGQNVHAVGVGSKVVEGKLTEEPCVRLYVVQKLADSLLSSSDVLPKEVAGIPTDVVESTPAFILPNGSDLLNQPGAAAVEPCTNARKKRQRPIVAGISAAHLLVTAGTISCFCRSTNDDDDPETIYALSNNHVFAQVNQANTGDDLYQPGPADGGTSADRFATLQRFVPIHLGGQTPNRVDAAIGKILPGIETDRRICSIGAISGVGVAEEKMIVSKHGRTTGRTEGFIFDLSLDALVGMDHNNPSIVARFVNQLRINVQAPFSAFGLGGDSGSLVVNQSTREAVGLYNAGPPGGEYGLANRIQDVLAELQIELL